MDDERLAQIKREAEAACAGGWSAGCLWSKTAGFSGYVVTGLEQQGGDLTSPDVRTRQLAALRMTPAALVESGPRAISAIAGAYRAGGTLSSIKAASLASFGAVIDATTFGIGGTVEKSLVKDAERTLQKGLIGEIPIRKEAGLTAAEIPDGLMSPNAKSGFFSDAVVERRRQAADTLRGLQQGVENGIVFFGDRPGSSAAIDNARRLKQRFDRSGERVLIISGHGGPFIEGQKTFGTHLLGRDGKNVAWFANNEWGGLELLDVLRRSGVSVAGYDKIVFATCHGGSACGLSRVVDVSVLGTHPVGQLHYSSNLVIDRSSPEGYERTIGPFLQDPDATRAYRSGKEVDFKPLSD